MANEGGSWVAGGFQSSKWVISQLAVILPLGPNLQACHPVIVNEAQRSEVSRGTAKARQLAGPSKPSIPSSSLQINGSGILRRITPQSMHSACPRSPVGEQESGDSECEDQPPEPPEVVNETQRAKGDRHLFSRSWRYRSIFVSCHGSPHKHPEHSHDQRSYAS
jgi:hypothetical protein